MFKPVTTVMRWIYQFNQHTSIQLPSSPKTPGWRRMTSEDIPSALALVNKWSSQFEIRQVFNSEEEFAYVFLLQKSVFTYIVEDKSNIITDLVSYSLFNQFDVHQPYAYITTVVSTESPVKQLIIDALVCATENGATRTLICQYNIQSESLASLSFQPYEKCVIHFYNYRYREISQTKFWTLLFYII